MFEGSLVESRGVMVSRAQRWSAVGSAALQTMVAVALVIVPLLRPQTFKILREVPHLTAPVQPVRTPQTPVHVSSASTTATSPAPTAAAPVMQSNGGSRHFSLTPGLPTDDGPPGPLTGIAMGGGPNPMDSLARGTGTNTIAVTRAEPKSVTISGGVSSGLLLTPIRPAYPPIARAAKVQGTVVIEATISKAGRIESAHPTSGPPMLQRAALEAVEAARYQPYLLSGQPVEVQTTITVDFRLGE